MKQEDREKMIASIKNWQKDRIADSNYTNLLDVQQMVSAMKDCFGDITFLLNLCLAILEEELPERTK